jgi:transposase-like protein
MSQYYARIVSLAKARVRPTSIANQLGVHPNTVYEAIRKARKSGEAIETFAKGPEENTGATGEAISHVTPRHLLIPMRLHSLLVQRASERGMTPSEYGQHLLEAALLGTVVRHD